MIEKISPVRNPLTIIAIFSTLSEIASTVALATVGKDLQYIFVWFVMLFPTILIVAFFLTLNFNPSVLYAPSDFTNEEHFIHMLKGTSSELHSIEMHLQTATSEIASKVINELNMPGSPLLSIMTNVLENELTPIRSRVDSVRKSLLPIYDRREYIATRPSDKLCVKCSSKMSFNHDEEGYICRNCNHWEYV